MINNNGLTSEEVIINRRKYGSNTFTKKKQDSFFKLLLETFSDPIIKILLIALGIKTIFLIRDFDWYETIGIVLAILIASLISSISEYGATNAFNKLTEETSKINVRVKRDGEVITIPIDQVVVNDVVVLSEGDKIPADGVLIQGNISVDESMMNGESKEAYKNINDMVYMSTVVYSGSASMLVRYVGDNTFYGKMAMELQDDSGESPLKLRLTGLAKTISKIGYAASFFVAVSYLFYMIFIVNGFDGSKIVETISNGRTIFGYFLDALTLCVTIIVVSVPEGLPMMITLVLSFNMKRMLKDNVLVRKLVGIETAGSINVLFTDKTGTLTNGKLDVVSFLDGSGNEINNMNSKLRELFNMSISINNESTYDRVNNKIIGGNITDKALLNFIKEYKCDCEIIKREEFNSKNKYMYTKIKYNSHVINLVKGAYEVLSKKCNSYYDSDGIKHMISNKNIVDKRISELSSKKLRVLALAISEDRETLNNLTLLGFVVLADEIRENVLDGIDMVKKASIQTIMVTGDNRDTAISIAKELNLIGNEEDIVITSDKLNQMSDDEVRDIFPHIKVIARAMPQDKSRLVNIAKSMDLVVGMTGDGVNDAIALKKADVGFAMGSGTEVAKEASDIVILDNNFYSIANAILYGRTIFKSIRKFIICQLTINLCSLLVSIIGPFIGIPVPITVIQMLWINMIMDTLSGLAFSYEPALLEYMYEEPKKKSEPIINSYMFNQILVTGLYSAILCIVFLKDKFINNIFGDDLMTAFFGLIIFISIFNSFSARTHRLNILGNISKNKVFIIIISFVIMMQIFLIYKGGELFRTRGLLLNEFIIMMILASTVIPIDFVRKLVLKKKGKKVGV
ncbi:MAG: calcium-translocating P-type ATPase, PMCA-type [Bacilli bacterium]|nr:calcium-translocating P-type ATPase, PMCA-type [Bacilli bacterium]